MANCIGSINTDEWEQLAEECKERDGHRYRVCNGTNILNIHHRVYPDAIELTIFDDLTTLCQLQIN